MATPQADNTVFYHPLDDRRAGADSALKWSGSAEFAPATADDGAFGAQGDDIAVGSQVGGGGSSVAKLDSNTFVTVYYATVASDNIRARARVGVYVGGTVSYGPEFEFYYYGVSTFPPAHMQVKALDSTNFLIVWRTPHTQYAGKALVGTATGTDLTFGSTVDLDNSYQANFGVAVLNPTTAVLVVRDHQNPNNAYQKTLTFAAGEVADQSGWSVLPDISMSGQIKLGTIDSTRALLMEPSGTFGAGIRGRVMTVPTPGVASAALLGPWHYFQSGDGVWGRGNLTDGLETIAPLGSGLFAVGYNLNVNSSTDPYEAKVILGLATSDTIASGTPATVYTNAAELSGFADYITLSPIGDRLLVFADTKASGSPSEVMVSDIVGATLELGTKRELEPSAHVGDAMAFSSSEFVCMLGSAARPVKILGDVSLGYEAGVADIDGPDNEFLTSGMSHPAMVALTPSTLVVGYADEDNSNHGEVKLATVAGDAVTFGSPHAFLSADGARDISLAALDSTHFVVAYVDDSDSGHGTCKVGLVTGDDVTFGAEYEFLAGACMRPKLGVLGATKFAVVYSETSVETSVRVGDVGGIIGLDITWGAPAVLQSGHTYTAIAVTGSSQFVVAYAASARVCAVAGTDVTLGAEAAGVRSNSNDLMAATLTETTVATCFIGAGSTVKVQVLTVVGDTVEAGPEASISGYGNLGLSALDSSHIVVCYRPDGDDLAAVGGTVAGGAVTFGPSRDMSGPPHEPWATTALGFPVVALSDTRFAVAYGHNYGDLGSLEAVVHSGHVRVGEADFSGDPYLGYVGAPAVYSATRADYNSLAVLGDSLAVVAFDRDPLGTPNGEVIAMRMHGTDVTLGARQDWGVAATRVSVAPLDSTRFIVSYADSGDALRGKAVIGEVDPATLLVTFGSVREFLPDEAGLTFASPIDSVRALVCYADGAIDGPGTAVVASAVGLSLSFGAASVFASGGTDDFQAAQLDGSASVVCYRDVAAAIDGRAVVATVAGMDVTFGPPAVFASNPYVVRCVAIDSTRFAALYGGGGGHGTVAIGAVAGTDVTFGAPAEFNPSTEDLAVAALGSSRIVAYFVNLGQGGSFDPAQARLGIVDGLGVEFVPGVLDVSGSYSSDGSDHLAIVGLGDDRFLAAWRESAGDYEGVAAIGAVELDPYPTAVDATKLVFSTWYGSSYAPGTSTTLPPSEAPTVNSPIYETMTTVTGTSTEADGTLVQVFVGYSPIGSSVTVSGGTWSKGLGFALDYGATVTAKTKATGEDWSPHSAPVNVTWPLGTTHSNPYTVGENWESQPLCAKLSETVFVFAYDKWNHSPSAYYKVGTLAGNTITWGAEYNWAFTGMPADGVGNVVALSATKVVVLHGASAVVGDLVGDEFTWGTPSTAPISGGPYHDIVALDATRVLVVNSGGNSAVGTVAGSDITFGSNQGGPNSTYHVRLAKLDTDLVIAASRTNVNSGSAKIGEVTGDTIAWGDNESLYSGTQVVGIAVASLGGGKAVVTWADQGTYRAWRSRVVWHVGAFPANIQASTITSTIQPTSGGGENSLPAGAVALSGARVFAAYALTQDGNWIYGKSGPLAGTAPNEYIQWETYRSTVQTPLHIPSGGTSYESMQGFPLTSERALFTYPWRWTYSSGSKAAVVWVA